MSITEQFTDEVCGHCGGWLKTDGITLWCPDCNGGVTSRTRVGHCKADDTDVYAGRGNGGRNLNNTKIGARGWLGNPHVTIESGGEYTLEESLSLFREDFEAKLRGDDEFREAVGNLSGKTLGCWCQRLDDDSPACHAEIIAEWADRISRCVDTGTGQ